jgi:heme/copper-type cytochrome/quinol oxidase subunit 3
VKTDIVIDVSGLDTTACGNRTLTWWGTLAFMTLEGSGFVLAAGAYLYLKALAPHWPGTIVALLLVASVPLNHALTKWAKAHDLGRVRIGLVLMCLFGVAPLVVRCFEFPALHVRWDDNAYGSAVWFLLGLHTTHLITDVGDTFVLTATIFTPKGDNGRRYSDVTDNAFYWDFVVLTWLPIYALIYWVPRLA